MEMMLMRFIYIGETWNVVRFRDQEVDVCMRIADHKKRERVEEQE